MEKEVKVTSGLTTLMPAFKLEPHLKLIALKDGVGRVATFTESSFFKTYYEST